MIYILLLIAISTILSYLILKCMYRFIFKSKKRISKFLVFLGSIALIIFYYTPYSYYLEPSFWQFRKMCKLNELPNDKEKYGAILKYFDIDFQKIDWKLLNNNLKKIDKQNGAYIQNINEYLAYISKEQYRISFLVNFYTNYNRINKDNITNITFSATWDTRRPVLNGNEGNMDFRLENDTIGCGGLKLLERYLFKKEYK